MEFFPLNDFTGGWFIGNFSPAIEERDDFEVSVKYYKAGDKESRHLHKLAVEYTVIAKGRVKMNGRIIEEGTIVKIEKNESTDFEVLEDTVTMVVKTPSVKNDKYII
jgi:mannose-6-phosphate isomerase-like protein (cupin superfamily)